MVYKSVSLPNRLFLFSILKTAGKITKTIIGTDGDSKYKTPAMGSDTSLILAQNIINDQCLVLTQETHQLHLLALRLQRGVFHNLIMSD